jgi:hypothetical protein
MKKRTVEVELTDEQSRAVDRNIERLEKEGFFDIFGDKDQDDNKDILASERNDHLDQVYQDIPHQDEPKKINSLEEQNPFLPNYNVPGENATDPLQPPIENPFIPGFQNKTEEPPIENPFIPKFSSFTETDDRFECKTTDKGRLCKRTPGK